MQIDFNGHCGYEIQTKQMLDGLSPYWKHEFDHALKRLSRLQAYGINELMVSNRCNECGKYLRFELEDDNTIKCISPQCEYAGGMEPYSVFLDVPSGKIVFANDLRSLVACDEPNISVNSALGKRLLTEAYARAGMIHICVGNSCPDVLKTENGWVVSRNSEPNYDNSKTEEENDADFAAWQNTYVSLGSICTDLWWYSAMDYDYFMEQIREENYEIDPSEYFTISVPPATYKFSDNMLTPDSKEYVFSNIELHSVRIPFIKPMVENDFDHFTYGKDLHKNIFTQMEYWFFTLGNGLGWVHGQPSAQTRQNDLRYRPLLREAYNHPRISEIPTFDHLDKNLHLYPLGLAKEDFYDCCGLIADTPRDVDPVWLSIEMMFVKSCIEYFPLLKVLREDEHADVRPIQLEAMRRNLDMLCEIGEERSLFADGTLEGWFSHYRTLDGESVNE